MTRSGSNTRRPASRSASDAQKTANPGWFAKGQSGNLRGRPHKSSHREAPSVFEVLLDKSLTVTKGDKSREITMEEALLQRTFQDALKGKRMAMREVMKWIKTREAWFAKHVPRAREDVTLIPSLDPDNADAALVLLGIAAPNPGRADVKSERAQLLLEPWAVQLGLHRKGGVASLIEKEREAVLRCTRDAEALFRQDRMD